MKIPKLGWSLFVVLLVAVLMTGLVPLGIGQSTSASTSSASTSSYCTNLITGQPGITSTSNSAGLEKLIWYSVLLLTIMLGVAGIAFMIGRSFGIPKLTAFGRSEILEVMLTGLIIVIFVSIFSAANTAVGSGGLPATLHNALGSNLYLQDCNNLYLEGVDAGVNVLILSFDQTFLTALSHLSVNAVIRYQGVKIVPFVGLQATVIAISDANLFIISVLALSFGTIAFLSIIYALFPLFLYVGIVLRTLPWTRAAGGSFIGLFIGFYIFFPLILHVMLIVNPVPSPLIQLCSSAAFTSGTGSSGCPTSNPFGYLTYIFKNIPKFFSLASCTVISLAPVGSAGATCLFGDIVSGVVGPLSYTLVAILLSIYLSFNFTEAISATLGAPSLKVSSMVKNFV
jgi:hypothetical protein